MANKLSAGIKGHFKAFLKTGAVMGLFSVSAAYGKAHYNRKNFAQILKERDTTRPSNENFGLNFGAAADRLLKDELDSGDVFNAHFDYLQFLSGWDIMRGFFHVEIQGNDNMVKGVGFRTDEENYLIGYKLLDKIYVKDYSDFLRVPFFTEISCSKIQLPAELKKNPIHFLGTVERVIKYKKEREFQEFFDGLQTGNYSLGKKIIIRSISNKEIREISNK